MEIIALFASEMFLGLSIRFLSMALVHAIFNLKLGNPHPVWGLLTVIWYSTTPDTALSAAFVAGFVSVDFKGIIGTVFTSLLGSKAETKQETTK